MNNNKNQGKNKKSQFSKKRILALGCVCAALLSSAMYMDSQYNNIKQVQLLVTAAQEVQLSNLTVRDTGKDESLVIAQDRAIQLSTLQTKEQKERDDLATEELAAAEAAKKVANTPVAVAYVAPPSNFGKFDPTVYGYSGADKLSYWKNYNSDTIGYLHIPGTNISHAVVQNTSSVNYYEKRGYDKQASYQGVIWTNPNTDSAGSSANMSDNTVLYGHNWTNVSANPRIGGGGDLMFSQLTGYHHLSMAKSYPYMYYSTSKETMVFKIFAVYYSGLEYDYIQTNGDNAGIIADAKSRSMHNFDVDVKASDKLLTLSTCTRAYGSSANQRFVVTARLLRPDEVISEVGVTSNTDFIRPNVR